MELQAAFLDCLFLDPPSHLKDIRAPTVIDIGGCQVVDALAVLVVGVVIDECADLTFEVVRQEVVFQENPVRHCLMPALNLDLCLRVMGCVFNVVHTFIVEIFGQIGCDVRRAVIAE